MAPFYHVTPLQGSEHGSLAAVFGSREDASAAWSRRLNLQHRLQYQALDDLKAVEVIRMWTHCE